MCKNNWFCSFQKEKISLTLQSAVTHSQSLRGHHNTSLLPSPQVSLTVAPFLGAPRRWSVSSSTHWGRTWLGTGSGALPAPMAILDELVHPSNQSSWAFAIWNVRTPVQKRTQNITQAWLSHWSGSSRGRHGWNLTGASRNVAETSNQETKHHTRRVGELRFITPAGPKELTLQALSPKQRGYRVFIDRL